MIGRYLDRSRNLRSDHGGHCWCRQGRRDWQRAGDGLNSTVSGFWLHVRGVLVVGVGSAMMMAGCCAGRVGVCAGQMAMELVAQGLGRLALELVAQCWERLARKLGARC